MLPEGGRGEFWLVLFVMICIVPVPVLVRLYSVCIGMYRYVSVCIVYGGEMGLETCAPQSSMYLEHAVIQLITCR